MKTRFQCTSLRFQLFFRIMKPTLQFKLSPHLTLTPQLQQSIRLLQFSTVELNQEIERIAQENPLLELDDIVAMIVDYRGALADRQPELLSQDPVEILDETAVKGLARILGPMSEKVQVTKHDWREDEAHSAVGGTMRMSAISLNRRQSPRVCATIFIYSSVSARFRSETEELSACLLIAWMTMVILRRTWRNLLVCCRPSLR